MKFLAVLLLIGASSDAFNWQSGDNGQVQWSSDCDFKGNDIGQKSGSGNQCGGFCLGNSQCTHFTYFNGVCYLKRFTSPATASNLGGAVCGWVTGGNNGGGTSQGIYLKS